MVTDERKTELQKTAQDFLIANTCPKAHSGTVGVCVYCERDGLRAALVHAVEVIQTWHNMDIRPRSACSELWDIYWKNAPEMKPIRTALAKATA
jgi:hypothetical protein